MTLVSWTVSQLQLISLLCIHQDFETSFDDHDSTLITWHIASQYVNGCKNKGRREFSSAVGSKTVRETSVWQWKLSTKRYRCNEATIPASAYYLKRKALKRSKPHLFKSNKNTLLVLNLLKPQAWVNFQWTRRSKTENTKYISDRVVWFW